MPSTIYGIDTTNLYTVNPTNGKWSLVAPLTGFNNVADLAIGLVWNTTDSTMYLTTSTSSGTLVPKIYIVNLANGNLTFVTNIGAAHNTLQATRGLAYDTMLNKCYAVRQGDGNISINATYILDLSTGSLTQIDSPASEGILRHMALAYQTSTGNVFGLSTPTTTGGSMYNVNISTGVWSLIGSILETGTARALTYDPASGIFYGSSFTTTGSIYHNTYTVNIGTGAWTVLGDTVNSLNPQAMAVVPATIICVRDSTLVSTARGRLPIAEVRTGDQVLDCCGQLQPVFTNLCSGSSSDLILIRRGAFGNQQPSEDLYIRAGHPLLINGREIEPQHLVDGHNIVEVSLQEPVRLHTLCTANRTFIDMQGLLVGTWSQAALENFVENDSRGQFLSVGKQ